MVAYWRVSGGSKAIASRQDASAADGSPSRSEASAASAKLLEPSGVDQPAARWAAQEVRCDLAAASRAERAIRGDEDTSSFAIVDVLKCRGVRIARTDPKRPVEHQPGFLVDLPRFPEGEAIDQPGDGIADRRQHGEGKEEGRSGKLSERAAATRLGCGPFSGLASLRR